MQRQPRRMAPLVPALPVVLAVVALLVAVTGAVLAGLASRQVSAAHRADEHRASALSAARQIAIDFAAYDYRHLPEDFKRVADETTGDLHKQYLTSSTSLKDQIEKVQAVASAEVTASAVMNATAARATVVLAVDRTVRTKKLPDGQAESYGLQMVLVRSHGQWLASEMTPL